MSTLQPLLHYKLQHPFSQNLTVFSQIFQKAPPLHTLPQRLYGNSFSFSILSQLLSDTSIQQLYNRHLNHLFSTPLGGSQARIYLPSLTLPSIVFNRPSHSLQHSRSSLMPSSLKEQLIFIEQLECTKYCAKVIKCIISLDPQTLLNRYYDHFLNVRKSKLSWDSNSKGK